MNVLQAQNRLVPYAIDVQYVAFIHLGGLTRIQSSLTVMYL
jgi:hypothetical protein